MSHKQAYGFYFDILAPEIKLNIGGKPSVATKFGTALSMGCIGIFIALAYVITKDYLDTSKPKLVSELVPIDMAPAINFSADKHYPILFFFYEISTAMKKPELDRFFNIRFLKYSESYLPNGTSVLKETKMKVVQCSDLLAAGRTSSIQVEEGSSTKDVMSSMGLCVDPGEDDMTLGNSIKDSDPYQIVLLQILPCSLPTGCASAEEIRKITFSIANPLPSVNLGNHKHPVTYITNGDDYQFVSMTLTSRKKLNYVKSVIHDNRGFLAGQQLVTAYSDVYSVHSSFADRDSSQIQCTEEQADDLSCAPYFVQEMMAINKVVHITREYKGVVEAMSEMGGMIDLIMLAFYWLYGFYNSPAFKSHLIQQIYGISKPKEAKNSCAICRKKSRNKLAYQQSASIRESGEVGSDFIQERSFQAKVYNELWIKIDDCLDIVTIAKEVNSLKLISHFLLSEFSKNNIGAICTVIQNKQKPKDGLQKDPSKSGAKNSEDQTPAELDQHEQPPVLFEGTPSLKAMEGSRGERNKAKITKSKLKRDSQMELHFPPVIDQAELQPSAHPEPSASNENQGYFLPPGLSGLPTLTDLRNDLSLLARHLLAAAHQEHLSKQSAGRIEAGNLRAATNIYSAT